MIGHNKLFINQVEMNAAIEYYLNNVVLKTPCTVTGVETTSRGSDNGFEIKLMPHKEPSSFPNDEELRIGLANGTILEK